MFPSPWWRIQSDLSRRELPTPIKNKGSQAPFNCTVQKSLWFMTSAKNQVQGGETPPLCVPLIPSTHHPVSVWDHGCLPYTDTALKEFIPKALGKYYMGELPSHKFCLLKLSCLIKLIEGIKKASGEEHVHQPVSSHSWAGVTSSGSQFPAGTAQSIISHYTDYNPLVLLSTNEFKPSLNLQNLVL